MDSADLAREFGGHKQRTRLTAHAGGTSCAHLGSVMWPFRGRCRHRWREKERYKIKVVYYDGWTGKRNHDMDPMYQTMILQECENCGELKKVEMGPA